MSTPQDWLTRLKNRQVPVLSWSDHRRNEALALLAHAESTGNWVELSRHYNGFIREVAVRELCRQSSPEALAALTERLNDWVPQVRDMARAGLAPYLCSPQATALLYVLEPVMALAACQRVDHAPTLAAIRAVLQAPDAHDQVYAHFLAQQGKAARYLFTLLLETASDPTVLLRAALAHRELTTRLQAVSACKSLPAEIALPLLLEALSRPGAKVRVCVLHALLPMLADPKPLLRDALLDASAAIRNLARWAATRYGIDPNAVLNQRLTQALPNAKRDWLGVLGLAAELGTVLTTPWSTQALESDYATVRQAAIHMLQDDSRGIFLAALEDTSDRVFRAAIAKLNRQPWARVSGALSAKLDSDWHPLPAPRRNAIFALFPSWQQLAYLLKRLDGEPVVQAYWLRHVHEWIDRQYLIVDPVTSRTDRSALVNTLHTLAASGLITAGQLARVT
ncbi:PBS lyase [Pseudomonas sp. O64]|uniref:PBS lyase n=1 Tax=unclassified Pseudomonas TaxID=196821 RepID=UPI0021DB4392|nr:PBS lyase [Pseudomonas sp. YeP6b]UXZ20191.1 PBS lyase [Pseudomonas sp. YeP6b]